jgi:hypothetical protein
MTVLSLQWLLARPRRSGARLRSPKRTAMPRRRRTHSDSFFADPNAVEDDYRRMRPGTRPR